MNSASLQHKKNQWALIVYLGALAAFAPFSTDIYLASMPTIQQAFHTTSTLVQLTLSGFFVGFAIMQLVWGPLSDRWGRKFVIYLGLIIFILGSLLCAFSTSIARLIIARFIQALGACAGIVSAMAIVKDVFTDQAKMTKILSLMISIMILAPIVAPIIGSYLLAHINWQANFYFLAVYGAILGAATLFIGETHSQELRKPLTLTQLCRAYVAQAKHPPFLLATLATATNFSVLFSFIATSSFIYIKIYHVAARSFGYYFGLNASAILLAAVTVNLIKKSWQSRSVVIIALSISTLAAVLLLAAIHFYPQCLWSIGLPIFISTFGVGMLFPELTGLALQQVLTHNGLASSLIGTARFVLAALMGLLVGALIHNSALALGWVMLLLNGCTVLLMLGYFRTQKS